MPELEDKFRANPDNTIAFRELAAQYQSQSQWEKLAGLYADRGQFYKKRDAHEAALHLLEAARYYVQYLKNPNKAYPLLLQAFTLEPDSQPLFAALEDICVELKLWKELFQLYTNKLEMVEDRKFRLDILRKAARLCEQNLNQPDQAISLYSRARELDPKHPDILKSLAALFEAQNQWLAAIDVWQSLLKMADSPENRDRINLQIGTLCEMCGDAERAATYYRAVTGSLAQATALSRLEIIYAKDRNNLALILTEKLESLQEPLAKAIAYKKLAKLQSNPEAAIAFYQRALEILPKDLEILQELSKIFWDKGQVEVWYEYQLRQLNLLDKSPEKVKLLHEIAVKLSERKDYEKLLLKIYEMILEHTPQDRTAIEKMIHIYRQTKQPESLLKALVHKSKYCSLTEGVATYFQIAKLLSESLHQEEEAKVYYNKVLELQEDHTQSLDQLKDQYLKSGNYQGFLEIMQKKLALDPSHAAQYYYEAGKIWRDLSHDLDRAIENFERAVEADPRFWQAFESLLPLLKSKCEWDRYLSVVERALLILKDTQDAIVLHVSAADIYLKKGELQRAEEHLQSVLRYDPAHAQVLEKLANMYQSQRRFQNYIEILETAARFLGTSEDLPRRYIEIARVYRDEQQHKQAGQFYEKAHLLAPFQEDILAEWQVILEKTGDEDRLLYCLATRAKLSDNLDAAVALLSKLAALYLKRNNLKQAIRLYEEALAKKPYQLEIIDQLAPLYEKSGDAERLFALLVRKSQSLDAPAVLSKLYEQLAQLAETKLHRDEVAISYWEKCLALSPDAADNSHIMDHLSTLYPQKQMWEPLVAIYRKKLAVADDQHQVGILRDIAAVYEQYFAAPWELKNIYQSILKCEPGDIATLTLLQKLCRKLEDWQGLLSAYRQEASVCSQEGRLSELFQEMGKIYQSYFPNLDESIACYHKSLEYDPENYEIWKNLHHLYLLKRDYERAIGMIDRELKLLADPELEANLFVEKGILYRDRLHNSKLAIQSFEQALSLCPTFREAIDALEIIFRSEKKFPELLNILAAKHAVVASDEALDIAVEMARIHDEHLGQYVEAENHLVQVIGRQPTHPEASRRLARLYYKIGNWDKLQKFYQKQLPYLRDSKQKTALLFSLGKLLEERQQDTVQAAACYVQVLNLEPGHLGAIKSLQKIYEAKGNLSALTEAYLAELAVPDILPRRRIMLHFTCAELFDKHLDKQEWAITHYQQALKLDADNLLAIRGLQRLYRCKQDHQALGRVLLSELSIEKDAKRLLQIHLELADIFTALQDQAETAKHLSKAYRYQPDNAELLERLKAILRQHGYWDQYVEYLAEEIERCQASNDRQRLHLELGQIYHDKLGNIENSIVHLEHALSLGTVPLDDLHRLQSLYHKAGITKYAQKLIVAYETEKKIATSSQRLGELWRQTGNLYDEELNAPEQAAACFEELLNLAPDNRDAYNALAKLYMKLEHWPKLAQLFCHMAGLAQATQQKEEWLFKTGAIWEKRSHDYLKAPAYYQMVLTLNPDHLQALQGMRRLYELEKNWHGVLEILYREAKLSSGTEQATIFWKIAKLWETRINQIPQAVEAYLEVLKNYFHQGTAEHLLSLLKGMKEHQTFCQVIAKLIKRTKDNDIKAQLLCELGDILWRELNQIDQAIQAYTKAIKCVPKKIEALSGLEEIYNKQEEWQELAKIKEQKLELITSSTQIRKLHLELGTICEHRLYDEKKAIFHYERALELAPNDFHLIHILERLYLEWGYFHRYIEVCVRESEITTDPQRKIEVYLEIARTWENKLLDDLHAIQGFEKVLEVSACHGEAVGTLLRLYERNHDYRNLVRLHELEVEQIQSGGDQAKAIALKIKIGNILRHKLYDYAKAEQTFRSILTLDPNNQQAIALMEEMFQTTNNLVQLSEIITRKLQITQDLMEKAQLYYQLGQAYEKQPNMELKAVDAYSQAHAIQPQHRDLLKNLQRLHRTLGNLPALVRINSELAALAEKESDKVSIYWENSLLLKEDQPEEVISYLEKIVAIQPTHVEALTKLAVLLEKQGLWERLEKSLTIWIMHENTPKKQAALYLRRSYVCLQRLGAKDKAIADLAAAFGKDPSNLEVVTTLARLDYEMEAWDKAQPLYDQLVQWPDREAIKSLNHQEIYFRWARCAEQQQKSQVALLRYQKVIELFPDHVAALQALGHLYYHGQQWEQSLLVYMKLNSVSLPEVEHAEVLLRLAVIKDKMGMTEGAIEGYLQVLQKNPHDPIALESLGSLYLARKQEEKAYECFQTLRQLVVEPAGKKRTLVWLAKICEELHRIPEAIERYEELTAIDGPLPDYLKKTIRLYCDGKLWDKALQCGEQLYRMPGSDLEKIEIEMRLGDIQWDGFHNQEQAVGYYEAVLTKVPTYLAAIRAIARIYQSLDNWEQVVAGYAKAIGRFPEHAREQKIPLLLEQAKITQEKLGNSKEAIPFYEKVLEIAPDHAGAHAALAVLWAKYPEKRGDAITGQRYLVNEDPFRVLSYHELFRLYLEDKEYDRVYLCYQALEALGTLLPEETKFVKQVPPRVASGWLDPWTMDQMVRETDRQAIYEIMASVDPYTDKAYPPTLEEKYQVSRQDRLAIETDEQLGPIVSNVMRMLGIQELSVYLCNKEIVGVENTQPASLVIGRPIVNKLNTAQLYFVIAHHLFYVSRNHVMAIKLTPPEYAIYVKRLVEAFADTGKELSASEESTSRKLRLAIMRKIRKQLEERMDILSEIYQADIPGFIKGLELAANKCGLLCSDSLKDSMQAYSFLRQHVFTQRGQQPSTSQGTVLEQPTQLAEVKDLFWFNLSDEHSRLRTELGLSVRWIR